MQKSGILAILFMLSAGVVFAQLPILGDLLQQVEETPVPAAGEIDLSPVEEMMEAASSDILSLNKLPAPVITVVTPEVGGYHDMYTVGVGTALGNRILYGAENTAGWISSHFSGTVGAGGGAIASVAVGFGVNIYDALYPAFNAIKNSVWRVRVVPSTELEVKSPIMISVSGPAVNPYTKEVNEKLTVKFEKTSGGWIIKDTKTGKIYKGHYGIFVIKPRKQLSKLTFSLENPGSQIDIVMAGLDRQGTMAVGRMIELATTGKISEVKSEELVSAMSAWIFNAMLLTENMQALIDMTSKASQLMPGKVNVFDPYAQMRNIGEGITVIVKGDKNGYPVEVQVLNY